MPDAIDPAMYAPQARLVDLASGKIIGTNVTSQENAGGGQTVTTIVSADLISVRVTLPSSGIGQLTVILNNQRFVEGEPIFPPWKYNDFSAASSPGGSRQDAAGTYALTFGQRVRLDIRYSSGPWTKLIVARITDLQFSFPASGAAQLQVTGEDMLSALKIKPTQDIPYDNKQEEVIARETLTAAGLTVPLRADGIDAREQPLRSARQQKSQTYYQFLNEIAERLDCELYVDFADRRAEEGQRGSAGGAIDVASELRVVMEPARSKHAPATKVSDFRAVTLSDGEFVELRWGRSLIDFTPKLKVWEMPTSASVSGSQPDRRGRARTELSESEVQGAIMRELPRSASYDLAPLDAVSARRQFFGDVGDSESNGESGQSSGFDEVRTRLKALAQVLKKVREFSTVEASTIGLPLLRPGVYVHVLGLRPPFDGFHYVTKTVHTLDANGYRTQFSLRRPGMLPPSAYQTPAREERAAASAGGGA